MAGDWIKVEHATLDKPEVLRIAEMLGISRRECLGLLLDFWTWLDRNARHACVTHMSRMSLDSVTHTPGFAACLCAVGWAEIDDATGQMTIKNYDRHNGNSAKTRALSRDRKVTQRSRESHAESVTREEKRRVNTSLRSVLDAPSEEHRSLAKQLGIDCDEQFRRYRDHFAATGKPHKNEEAGFRNWLRRSGEFRPRVVANRSDARAAVAAAIFGDSHGPDAIDGTAERVA